MPIFQIVSALNTSGINGLNGMTLAIANCALWIPDFPRKVAIPG